MKNIVIGSIAALGLGAASFASAAAPEQGFYLGGVLTQVDVKFDGVGTVSPSTLAVQGGWKINRNFAIEARIGSSVGDDTIQGVKFKIDSYYSGYLRGSLPVSETFNFYALAGYTSAKAKASAGGLSSSDSDSDFSYGIGGEVAVRERHGISLEWGRFVSGDGYHADGLSIGYRYHF